MEINLGPLVKSALTLDTAYGIENGKHMMYTTTNGNPAVFCVVDLEANKVIGTYSLPGTGSVWSHVTDNDGNVYIAGTGHLYVYRPDDQQVTDLGAAFTGARAVYGLSVDEDNNVYGGTYPQARVFQYNARLDQFTDYGRMSANQDYVRSGAYWNGSYYAGIGTRGDIVKLNVQTGEKVPIPLPDRSAYYTLNDTGSIYGLNIVDPYLFAMIKGSNVLIIYDLVAEQWLPVTVEHYKGLHVSPEMDGKTFFIANDELTFFDFSTHEVRGTGIKVDFYLRNSTWIQWPNAPQLPGKSLVTIQHGGTVTLLHPKLKTVKLLPQVIKGVPILVQSIAVGPDNKIYSSGYMGQYGSRYHFPSGQCEPFPLGQSEGMTSLGKTVYFGIYPGARIYALDTTVPLSDNNPKQLFTIEHKQDRPFAMHASTETNQLFIGTIADYGELGGALTIYNEGNGEWETHRHVVQDQSVIGLAYREGKVYGSTTVWGGLGVKPTAEAAKIFVWDVQAKEKIAEFVPELPSQSGVLAKAIGGLLFGPDGLLWGAARGVIFALNPQTYEVEKSNDIYPTDWNFNHYWRPVHLHWGTDGYLYTTLASRIVVIDPRTLDYVELGYSPLMTLGPDGDLYFTDGANLKKIETEAVRRRMKHSRR